MKYKYQIDIEFPEQDYKYADKNQVLADIKIAILETLKPYALKVEDLN